MLRLVLSLRILFNDAQFTSSVVDTDLMLSVWFYFNVFDKMNYHKDLINVDAERLDDSSEYALGADSTRSV